MIKSRFEPKIYSVFSVILSVAVLFFAAPLYANVLLIINDANPESVSIGNYYASKRNAKNLCHIRTTESITRETFESDILKPIAACIRANSLQDDILYIVTTKGVPLTVDGESVDSKLALTYQYLVTGSMPYGVRIENPYFAPTGSVRPFTRKDHDIYLVTRLTSLELIDQALSAESGGDFYFDLASPRQSTELDWVQQAAAALKKSGLNATVETTAKVLDDLPSVQGYVSQLASEAPLIKWKPGAIAMVLDKEGAGSAASYVQSGLTGFGYYTGDPLADGYFRPQILFPAYVSGLNLAEAFYASSRYLNGRNVVIGDPLVCPYAAKPRPPVQTALDKETGLPEIFSKRRMNYLMSKYSTSREAVVLLLKAEASRTEALSLADKALEQDPYLAEATDLRSRLAPPPALPAPAPKSPEPSPVTVTAEEIAQQPVSGEMVSLDFPSRLISKTLIEYPDDARLARVQGVVVVNLLIDEMGQVMKVDLVSGDRRLAKPVLASAKYWRFEPELENGRAIVSRLTVPVTFRITK